MKIKEWNLIINEKEYNIKLEISSIFKGINLIVNNKEAKFAKNIMVLRSYIIGIPIIFKIEEKDIVIYILNGKADLAIDGYFLESKKACYLNNKEIQYTSIILSGIFLTISMLTVIAALSTNILIMSITFISLIIASIYITKIRCRIDITINQKFLRYFIVTFIHWMLFITLCLNKLH